MSKRPSSLRKSKKKLSLKMMQSNNFLLFILITQEECNNYNSNINSNNNTHNYNNNNNSHNNSNNKLINGIILSCAHLQPKGIDLQLRPALHNKCLLLLHLLLLSTISNKCLLRPHQHLRLASRNKCVLWLHLLLRLTISNKCLLSPHHLRLATRQTCLLHPYHLPKWQAILKNYKEL